MGRKQGNVFITTSQNSWDQIQLLCSPTPLLKAGPAMSHCSGPFPISFWASPSKKIKDSWDIVPMFGHISFSLHSCILLHAHCLLSCFHFPENSLLSLSVCLSHPTRTLYTLIRYPEHSLLQAKQSQISLSLYGRCCKLQAPNVFPGSPLHSPQQTHVSLGLYSRCALTMLSIGKGSHPSISNSLPKATRGAVGCICL